MADPAYLDSGSRLAPRNWRVATRLNAILLLPVLLALGLAGLRVHDHYDTWREAERAQAVAELVHASAAYAHALIDERDLTAEPLLAGNPDDPVVVSARQDTDDARAEFELRAAEAPVNESLQRRLDSVNEAAPQLDSLRQIAYTEELPGPATELAYVEVQHPVMSFTNELGLGADNLAAYGRSVYAVSLAKAALSLQRSLGTHMILAEDVSATETEELSATFASYVHLEGIARNEYRSAAGPDELNLLDESLAEATGAAADEPSPTDTMIQPLSDVNIGAAELAAAGITSEAWFAAATDRFDGYRMVETELVDVAVLEAEQIAAEARTNMITNSLLVVVLLLVTFVLAGLMARAMSKSMSRLRDAALGVAEEKLPALVEQLSRTQPGRVATDVRPIQISSRDEIGEVSRAFDQVHREAVRLAAEQALLRGNVNAIFTNLAGRNQGLIGRQLELITELENNEADPEQLENLFRLDHLATRMRRNGENLLVLAGEEPGGRWNQPVPLVDVLRAAASEVEDYGRIRISGVPENEIHGRVVNDLAHLLAELLENATKFSSPHTSVDVAATRLPDGRIMVEIHDKGIGLTAEDFADINYRLASPPAVDAEISRRMGLYVVGRLSQRHGIRVQLRPAGAQTGTTSLVMLPENITHGGHPAPEQEDFTVSQVAVQPAPLGGDPSLDPVSRSLRRGERQAELVGGGFPSGQISSAAPVDTGPYGIGDSYDGAAQLGAMSPTASGGHADGGPDTGAFGTNGPNPAAEGSWENTSWTAQGYHQQMGEGGHFGQAAGGIQPTGTPFGPDHFSYGRQPGAQGHLPTTPPQAVDGATPYGVQQGEQSGYAETLSRWADFAGGTEEADTPPTTPPQAAQRVGFDGARPPQRSDSYSTTNAGLPRREPSDRPDEATAERQREEPLEQATQPETWDGGPRRDTARSDGVTTSGLPRRVPKANLTEHHPAEPADGAPQISRAPEDVRGRLANLHRGVRQGRGASTGRNERDQEGFGPGNDDQER